MGKRENKVETYLTDEVEKLGGITRKWVSPMHKGVTDQIVIIGNSTVGGLVLFVEVKVIDGVLEDYQDREHKRLRRVGADVTVVYGEPGVDLFIQRLKNRLLL